MQTDAFAEADDGPQTESQSAAAAQTATQQPAHIHRQRLPQTAVYTTDTGFKLLRCHLQTSMRTIMNTDATPLPVSDWETPLGSDI